MKQQYLLAGIAGLAGAVYLAYKFGAFDEEKKAHFIDPELETTNVGESPQNPGIATENMKKQNKMTNPQDKVQPDLIQGKQPSDDQGPLDNVKIIN